MIATRRNTLDCEEELQAEVPGQVKEAIIQPHLRHTFRTRAFRSTDPSRSDVQATQQPSMNGEFKVPSLPSASGSGSAQGIKRKEYENGSSSGTSTFSSIVNVLALTSACTGPAHAAESSKKARQSHDPLMQNAWIDGPSKSRGSGGPPRPPSVQAGAGSMAPPPPPPVAKPRATVEDVDDEEAEMQRYQGVLIC